MTLNLKTVNFLLRWGPLAAIIVATWLRWGITELAWTGLDLSFFALGGRLVLVEHLDFFLSLLFFSVALAWRLKRGLRFYREQVVWIGSATILPLVGALSAIWNESAFEPTVATIASLGRLGIFWAGLMLLEWPDVERARTLRVLVLVVIANFVASLAQCVGFLVKYGLSQGWPGDRVVGIFGFSNDAALLSLTAGVAILTNSALSRSFRIVGFLALVLVAAMGAFNTGLVGQVLALPVVLFVLAPHVRQFIRRTVAGLIFTGLVTFSVLTVMYFVSPSEFNGYAGVVSSRLPGFAKGFGIIGEHLSYESDPLTMLVGRGPGQVNSRSVSRLHLDPAIPNVVVSYPDFEPLTFDQMNQSILVAFAEFGVLGLIGIFTQWALIMGLVAHRARSESNGFGVATAYGIGAIFVLGIINYYWNESGFGYLFLLAAGALVGRGIQSDSPLAQEEKLFRPASLPDQVSSH